jgi:hypothetical protein
MHNLEELVEEITNCYTTLHTNRCCRIFLIIKKKNELENLEHNGYHFQPFERLQVILVLDPACALLSKISW